MNPTPQALTTADNGIVQALEAVGDCLPVELRDGLIKASDWCWLRRVDEVRAGIKRVMAEDEPDICPSILFAPRP